MDDKNSSADALKNDRQKLRKTTEIPKFLTPAAITRERSFIRTSNQQINKRRSLAFNVQPGGNQPQPQMRVKPAMDIYRPPNIRSDVPANKLNVKAQEFTMMPGNRSLNEGNNFHSSVRSQNMAKTKRSLHHPMEYMGGPQAYPGYQPSEQLFANAAIVNMNSKRHHALNQQVVMTNSPPTHLNQISPAASQRIPLTNSPSTGNIFHETANSSRMKFAPEPQILQSKSQQNYMINMNNTKNSYYQQKMHDPNQYLLPNANQCGMNPDPVGIINVSPLQRSKSLSSADALTRGIAGLGLALGYEVTDIGEFSPKIEVLIDVALHDPNKLTSLCLMELTSHFIKRSVEGRRYALPISRLCLNIIAKERKETFLEALLNTCRQWYQGREELLFAVQGMKFPSRERFTAFMAFLTEMFCQLKRRQIQRRTQNEVTPPPLVLLTLLSKCCEDCLKPPVRSLSEIECLFYVLTCIGQDMEMQLPQQLEVILSLVRDAFLNASDSAPAIRRTLLQLIELKASHWQLPGNTVLYYYPSPK